MQTIALMNSKGGCGKSTVATNLASYFSNMGYITGLADLDTQGSSEAWLRMRTDDMAPIYSVNYRDGQFISPHKLDVLIVDTPAAMRGAALSQLLAQVDHVIIPVLPSPIDIRAAGHFIYALLHDNASLANQLNLGVVANRVRFNTITYRTLESFLKKLDIKFVTSLRDSQHYVQTAALGLGAFDLPPSMVIRELKQWKRLTNWLSKTPESVAKQRA